MKRHLKMLNISESELVVLIQPLLKSGPTVYSEPLVHLLSSNATTAATLIYLTTAMMLL